MPVSDSPAPSGPASSQTWPWGRGSWVPVRSWPSVPLARVAEGSEPHAGGDESPPQMEQGRPQTPGLAVRAPVCFLSSGCWCFSGSS